MTTAIRSASTRPRIARSVVSCIIELLAVMKVSAARPTKNSTTPNRSGPGITAATATPRPNPAADTAISTIPGTGRRADSSAPHMVPAAIAEVSRPYWLASPWNTVTDMVEMKMAKLNPNVPSRNSIASTATRSGRRHTYRNPASRLPRVRSGKASVCSSCTRSSHSETSTAA